MNINNNARDVGHRLTGSYVDQFNFGDGQRLGISIGGQTRRTPIAEQEARSTSNFEGCTLSLIASFAGDLDNCDQEGQRAEDTDPVTGDRIGVTEDFVLTSSSRELRQQVTDDQRDSIFGAIQYQPNDRIDINLDAQYSKRDTFEERNIILINAREILAPGLGLPGFELTTAPDGSLRTATTFNGAEHQSETQDRFEDYIGLGGSIGFDVTDRLNLFVDASYSETERTNEIVETRLRTPNLTAGIGILQNGSEAQQFTLLDFDINDPNNFARGDSDGSDLRVREDLDAEVSYDISAIRADLTYDFDNSWLTQLKAGARFSSQNFTDVPRIRRQTDGDDLSSGAFASSFNGEDITVTDGDIFLSGGGDFGTTVANACANETFPETNFLDGETNGNLFTNIDNNGNVIEAGTGNTFFTTQTGCLANAFLGRAIDIPTLADLGVDSLVTSSITELVDYEEETIAAYLQADFETSFDGLPVRGNIGARIVNTDTTSRGLRSEFETERDAEDLLLDVVAVGTGSSSSALDFEEVVGNQDYTEILPSLNLIVDVNEDLLLRGAVFRALSRPSPRDLGFGRNFSTGNPDEEDIGEEELTVEDFVSNVQANGNPFIDPFLSWNFDAAVEWYPNPDTIVAIGAYYKVFDGELQTIAQQETFVIDGEDVTVPVEVRAIGENSSKIYGFETTVSHAFDYLPGLWSGLGFKASYNFADSDFETQDGNFGEVTQFDSDGNPTVLSAIIPPVSLQGLSRHTASGQLYYNIGKLDLTGIVKHRSRYFQPGTSNPTTIRLIDTATTVDARASYKLNDNIKLSLEGTNLTNEARTHLNPTEDNFAELNVYGPRYTLGLTAKF